jgi:hypothetical protein
VPCNRDRRHLGHRDHVERENLRPPVDIPIVWQEEGGLLPTASIGPKLGEEASTFVAEAPHAPLLPTGKVQWLAEAAFAATAEMSWQDSGNGSGSGIEVVISHKSRPGAGTTPPIGALRRARSWQPRPITPHPSAGPTPDPISMWLYRQRHIKPHRTDGATVATRGSAGGLTERAGVSSPCGLYAFI